jgi:hypothetical protein
LKPEFLPATLLPSQAPAILPNIVPAFLETSCLFQRPAQAEVPGIAAPGWEIAPSPHGTGSQLGWPSSSGRLNNPQFSPFGTALE